MSQLKEFYEKEAVPKLIKAFEYKNIMQVPRLEKVVLNMGMGEAIQNIKLLDAAVEELRIIAGQKPVITMSRKAIAGFKSDIRKIPQSPQQMIQSMTTISPCQY